MKTKTEKLFWTSNPMEVGGAIHGRQIHRNLIEDTEGFWEITSATSTGRKSTMRLECDGMVTVMPTEEYVVTMRLCTERDVAYFLEEELSRN